MYLYKSDVAFMKLSPSQALLILLDKEEYKYDTKLRELFLRGIESPEDRSYFEQIKKDPVLSAYQVVEDEQIIDSDPSRRYFESHLSFESAKEHFKYISEEELEANRDYIFAMSDEQSYSEAQKLALLGAFDANKYTYEYAKQTAQNAGVDPSMPAMEPIEFGDAINMLMKNCSLYKPEDFSSESKEKMITMIQCCYLAVINVAKHNSELPFVDITNQAPYIPQARGRVAKDVSQMTVTTNAAGLMKSTMPIPIDDKLYREEGFSFLKPADRNCYIRNAAFIAKIFNTAFNVFSSSISGTTLCQIKILAQAAIEGKLQFDDPEKLKNFFRCFISLVQFNSGGHSLIEFCKVFELPEIQSFFSEQIKGFDSINVINLFLEGNEKPFEKALTDSI